MTNTARLKSIDKQKLHYPFTKDKKRYGNLEKILKDTINWELMVENYDETIKYMVALKLGLIEPDMFIKRFSHDNYQHPVYKTLLEFGKVAKTIFLCRYLSDEDLRIENHASQNIVERLNSIMSFIFYGKVGVTCQHFSRQAALKNSRWHRNLLVTDNR